MSGTFVAVTQAFLPMLMNSAYPTQGGCKSVIVNNTFISSVLRTPYHSAYGASEAAMAAFNDTQRIELEPFGTGIVDLKTGNTESTFQGNKTNEVALPPDSPCQSIRDEIMEVITGNKTESYAENKDERAKSVVHDLFKTERAADADLAGRYSRYYQAIKQGRWTHSSIDRG